MRKALVLSAVFLSGGIVFSCPQAPSPDKESPEKLVACLGDDSPASRDDAEERIVKLGDVAEPVVRKALLSDDHEIAARSRGILQRLAQIRKLPDWLAALPEAAIQTGSWKGWTSTRLEDGRLVMEDSPSGGKTQTFVCEATPPFRLISAKCESIDARVGPWSGTVVDGTLQVAFPWPGLKPIEIDVKNVATDSVMFRLLPLLPQRPGETLEYDAFFLPCSLKLFKTCTVSYVGEEEIDTPEGKVMSHTWELYSWSRLSTRRYRVVGKRVVRMEISWGPDDLQIDFTPEDAK